MASSLIQHIASSLTNIINGKGVIRAGKGQEAGFHLSLALLLMMKVLERWVMRVKREYNNIDQIDKTFSPTPYFKRYRNY